MQLNPTEVDKLPKEVRYALSAFADSTVMLDAVCERQRDNTAAYDAGYETVALLAHRASNKILAYCRTPNDSDFKAKLRAAVWSRTHAC